MYKCEWEPFLDKFKCKHCGIIVPRDTIKHVCGYLNNKDKDIPNIIKRGKNLAGAVVNHISGGLQHCTEEEKAERYKICKSNKCGLFRPQDDGGICAHDDCGCYIRSNGKFMDKLSWADSKCPVGCWGPIEKKED